LRWCAIILGLCTGILLLGRYKILDNLMKVIIITLSISTLIALLSVLIWGSPATSAANQQHFAWDVVGIGFLLALMGWMPAPLDLAVWSSIWSLEKKKLQPENNLQTALLDFNIGYIGTAFLAFSFLALGALVMYGSGETLSPKGAVFASQLINLYTSTLGDWARPVIAIAAFTTMFSTTLTCLDAFPRVMRQVTTNIVPQYKDTQHKNLYWIWMLITIVGTFVLLSNISSMGQMISIATILSFLTAPVLAFINYKLVTSTQVPSEHQPPAWLLYLSWGGFAFLLGFCGLYLSTFF
jgi:Mn2+/Fe2+ NRAMP family transporter